jgi:hypothetical protein
LDASDTATITESGGSVSQWNDKSGNNRHVTQGTGIKQPTTGSETKNGRNVIVFDGTNDELTGATSALARNVAALTIYIVYKFNISPTTARALLSIQGGGASPSVRFIVDGGAVSERYRAGGRSGDGGAGFIEQASTTATNTTDYRTQTAVANYAGNNLELFIGSDSEGSVAFFGTNTANTDSVRFRVGAASTDTPVFFAPANIAEMVVFHAAHDATTRGNVWTYLNAKWGL